MKGAAPERLDLACAWLVEATPREQVVALAAAAEMVLPAWKRYARELAALEGEGEDEEEARSFRKAPVQALAASRAWLHAGGSVEALWRWAEAAYRAVETAAEDAHASELASPAAGAAVVCAVASYVALREALAAAGMPATPEELGLAPGWDASEGLYGAFEAAGLDEHTEAAWLAR
ncbi:hypothetical protein, partial [Chondromyces apiculatus]|uniref:hypothetical protein n=1 Tax=Chondromyces apiculatus TaxID=51 RepID=UPI0005C5EA94